MFSNVFESSFQDISFIKKRYFIRCTRLGFVTFWRPSESKNGAVVGAVAFLADISDGERARVDDLHLFFGQIFVDICKMEKVGKAHFDSRKLTVDVEVA